MGKLLNIKYGGLHGTYWMLYGIVTSFASAFLLGRGYTNGEIGVILAVGNVVAVFLQPLMADFADRSKKISLLGFLQLSAMLMLVLTVLTFMLQRKSAALWVVYMLNMAWFVALQPLLNSLSFKLEETGVHINFGVCRSVGCVFYAALCACLGTLVESFGVQVLPVSGGVVLVIMLLTLMVTKSQFNKMMAGRSGAASAASGGSCEKLPDQEEINLIQFMSRNKLFVVMNLACIGIFFGNSILNSFMLQVVEGVGGNSEDMGRILSVMAALEIPGMVLFDRVRRKFSCQTVLKFAAICFTLKILLIYMADSVAMIYVAHLLQTFSFGLFLPAMVHFINEIMAHGEAVKGQALYTVMTTVASVIASIAGGFILDIQGPSFLLLVSTVLSAAGSVLVVLLVGRIRKKA